MLARFLQAHRIRGCYRYHNQVKCIISPYAKTMPTRKTDGYKNRAKAGILRKLQVCGDLAQGARIGYYLLSTCLRAVRPAH